MYQTGGWETSTDKEEMHPVTKDLLMSIISMALMGILQDN